MQVRTVRLFQWIEQADWLVLLLLAPLFLFIRPETSWILLIPLLFWGFSFLAERKPLVITPLNGVILLLAIQVLVSLYATYDIAVSLPKVALMVYSIALFFALTKFCRTTSQVVTVMIVFLGAGLAIASLGFLGTNWATTKITIMNPIYELMPNIQEFIPGLQDGFHPNEVAGALTWVAPMWLALFAWLTIRMKKVVRVTGVFGYLCIMLTVIFANALTLIVLVFTQSRSAYLGFAAGMVLMVFVLLPRKLKWAFAGVLLAGVGGLVYLIVRGEFMVLVNALFPGTGLMTTAFSINTLSGRIEIWARGIYAIQDFAFTGMGMNTFRHIVHVLYPLYAVNADVPVKDIGHAHNEILQSGLDLGFPGMIAFIGINILAFWMLFASIRQLRRRNGHGKSDQARITKEFYLVMAAGLLGGLFAHFVFGVTDAISLGAKPGVLFWVMLCLVGVVRKAGE